MPNITFSQGSGLNDSVFGKAQNPIRMFLEQRGEQFEQESVLKLLFLMGTSQNYADAFTNMTAMDGFDPVGENGAYPNDGMQEGYQKLLVYETWKNSFSISQEIIEDSKLMDLRKQPAAFMTSYHRTRERFAACLYGNAIQGNAEAKYRGKVFDITSADKEKVFSTAHPSKVRGGKQSNLFKDAFSADALGALETKMQLFRGDNNEILDVAPDTIVIPNVHALKKEVFAAIGADKDPNTANNAFNYQFGRWTVICWPYLNQFIKPDTLPWMLTDSKYNEAYGGAVWNDRIKLAVRSTLDENTDANVWRGRSRFNAGFNDWRFAAVAGVATGDEL
ncbi:MAG: Mu-like prophage major head subunit gpT family protein [Oscillospiraceae bacterium]|nr:Mu-like prophage major head subunit gpT family protein [Oscillospiraceae bacterium]